MDYLDKEYHPVIEDLINDYSEGRLEGAELTAFIDVCDQYPDIKALAVDARATFEMIRRFRFQQTI